MAPALLNRSSFVVSAVFNMDSFYLDEILKHNRIIEEITKKYDAEDKPGATEISAMHTLFVGLMITMLNERLKCGKCLNEQERCVVHYALADQLGQRVNDFIEAWKNLSSRPEESNDTTDNVA